MTKPLLQNNAKRRGKAVYNNTVQYSIRHFDFGPYERKKLINAWSVAPQPRYDSDE